MLILGIETSCDETAAAVVKNGYDVLSSVISSSLELHSRYGGVVPEIAARHQLELINPVVKKAVLKAKKKLKDIDAVAVANSPGLVGALLTGVVFAKSFAYALRKPVIGINHLEAHIYSGVMGEDKPRFPFLGMLISGGHTSILYVKNFDDFKLIGDTQDDACGESFDKVAKILGLGYPGGPIIERLAEKGDPDKIRFPRTDLSDSYNFSFSGLKTAVMYYVKSHQGIPPNRRRAGSTPRQIEGGQAAHQRTRAPECRIKEDIAAGFQEAAADMLVSKVIKAAVDKKVKDIVVGGGVSANKRLRYKLKDKADIFGLNIFFPPMELCIDNAAMVAGLACHKYKKGKISNMMLNASANVKWNAPRP